MWNLRLRLQQQFPRRKSMFNSFPGSDDGGTFCGFGSVVLLPNASSQDSERVGGAVHFLKIREVK